MLSEFFPCPYISSTYLTVVIVLHLSHKLTYLQNASWSEDWIATAKDIVKTEFEQAYARIDSEEGGEDVVCSVTPTYCFP
jgi:hypothetical protein